MQFIKNFDVLASSPERKIVLTLIEEAFAAIAPQKILDKQVALQNNIFTIAQTQYDLSQYKRIFLIGFGKGSSGITKYLEKVLGEKLTTGFDIDVVDETFQKISYTKGTHPLPSQTNIDFTENVLRETQNLTEQDLVLVVICGGGSAMFESPHKASLELLDKLSTALLRSGATIEEINVIRKHLSKVKGGDLAKHLYPATVVSLIFSDVPGSDLSVIASGPTVRDATTIDEARNILQKYNINSQVPQVLEEGMMWELPHEEKYFANVHNLLMLSNTTALSAMQQKAKELGIEATIFSDRVEGNAKTIGSDLIVQTPQGQILLAGGETTVHVTGKGKGGRNQSLVLGALLTLQDSNVVIASFDSDGWDFMELAGAIGDMTTLTKAQSLHLDPKAYLDDDNTLAFFKAVGDGIDTGKQESNVSDLMVIYKK